ncbi:E3 ubiquitin-protein ligase Ubr3, partial [Hyalella azteca]|uniref:E3 ubiquitin-protein ligase n=1 Tax=Hyalella azteca TaxID=294128 RepID=A0A979FQN8_HYAAZ
MSVSYSPFIPPQDAFTRSFVCHYGRMSDAFTRSFVCHYGRTHHSYPSQDAFTRSFVCHYGRICHMLNNSSDFVSASHRAVHVSVQLFSDQKLALRMVQDYPLLDVLVVCIQRIFEQAQVDFKLNEMDPSLAPLRIVDIRHRIMRKQCFWPFVSDLNNLLGHRPIATMLISNLWLRNQFFSYIAAYQFMNPVDRRVQSYEGHVGGEEPPYLSGVSCELEVISIGVWNLLGHLDDPHDEQCVSHMMVLVDCARKALLDWFKKIGFSGVDTAAEVLSFHLPLHRVLALYLSHATRVLRIPLARLVPSFEVLSLAIAHPLKVQLIYQETLIGLHKSPLFDIPNQVSAFIHITMGHITICTDLYILQLAAAHLRPQAVVMATLH